MRLLLIRHGQTPSNVAGALDTGFPGPGLTRLGQAQAAALPAALAAEPIAAVYASPLIRTQHTAAPLADRLGLSVVVRSGLEEISAGEVEMRTDPASVEVYLETLGAWIHGDVDRRMPGAETGAEFVARYDAALAAIAADHEAGHTAGHTSGHTAGHTSGPTSGHAADAERTVVAVSHGAAIRVYASLAAGLDPDEVAEQYLMNTGMVALTGRPGDWRMERWEPEPLGGTQLEDLDAHDPTGERIDDDYASHHADLPERS